MKPTVSERSTYKFLRNVALLASIAMAFPAIAAAQSSDTSSVTLPTATGTKTVVSSMPEAPAYGPPPPFSKLDSNHDGYISQEEANAYPLLANDFIYADSNRDGRISKQEYQRWTHSRE